MNTHWDPVVAAILATIPTCTPVDTAAITEKTGFPRDLVAGQMATYLQAGYVVTLLPGADVYVLTTVGLSYLATLTAVAPVDARKAA